MIRPPVYPQLPEPGTPQWRRWWLCLVLLWGACSASLLVWWPQEQSRQELWIWQMSLPLVGGVALALRHLGWRIGRHQWATWVAVHQVAELRWWQRRALGLPIEQALLIGPAGDSQTVYRDLMAYAPVPRSVLLPGIERPVLPCPLAVALVTPAQRATALATQLAQLTLALDGLAERWPHLRGIAWAGDPAGEPSFVQALTAAGATLPTARVPLGNLADLDALIDGFYAHCRHEADWVLCAGVMPVHSGDESGMPGGEAGFVWLVGWHGKQLLHRGDCLPDACDDLAAELCANMQRSAGLDAAPPTCLAMDVASQQAFVASGWPVQPHLLGAHWGALGALAPFIGMSLALLQAQTGQPCGWLAEDGEQRLTIGMAVPYDIG